MTLALDLHIPEEEILEWPLEKFERWLAFYKAREKLDKQRQHQEELRNKGAKRLRGKPVRSIPPGGGF